jgi:hypothetical protein
MQVALLQEQQYIARNKYGSLLYKAGSKRE